MNAKSSRPAPLQLASNAIVLVVGGPDRVNEQLASRLAARGYGLVLAASAAQAIDLFAAQSPAAVLMCLPLKNTTVRELSGELRKLDAHFALIVTGTDSEVVTPGDAFDLGAYEYLTDLTSDAFFTALGTAIGVRRGDVQLRYLRQKDAPPPGWESLVGDSSAMQNVIGILRQVCRRMSQGAAPTILLNGETGTGKGFIAKCVHYNGARRNRAFVEINCAALPPTLIEAELFGHERGAFTDAKMKRIGLFEAANGGTLFLDEIGALPLDLQAKLLTGIEEKRVRRIGGHQSTPVDVQIIAATHENLEQLAREKRFRSDLFHRLNVLALVLPPLRERARDAVQLAKSFIDSICRDYGMPPRKLTDGACEWIRRYEWPGNVRELRNRIERILLLENDDELRAEHFGPTQPASGTFRVSGAAAGLHVELPPEGVPLEELERAVLREALAQCNGNVSRAARFLSISRQTLIYRMKKYELGLSSEQPLD